MNQTYNSNIVLTKPAEPVGGTSLEGNADWSVRETAWDIHGRTRLSQQFYYPASNINMFNAFLDGASTYRTERSRWSLMGSYVNAYSLSSQVPTADVTGLVLRKLHRDVGTASPSWTYSIDELTSATLNYMYSHAQYDYYGGGSSLQESNTVGMELRRQFTEKFYIGPEISYSHYNTTRENPDYFTFTDYVSASLSVRYSYDETLTVDGSAGVQISSSENEFPSQTLVGYALVSLDPVQYVPIVQPVTVKQSTGPASTPLFNVTARKQFELGAASFTYAHQVSPSFNGVLLETDRLGATGTRHLTELLDGSLGFSYYAQSYSGGSSAIVFSDYSSYAVDGSLIWRFAERWSATATYRYFYRDYSAPNTVNSGHDSQSVSVGISYNFDPVNF